MKISNKSNNSIFRVITFFIILLVIATFQPSYALASDSSNTLHIYLNKTPYKTDEHAIFFSPVKEKNYEFTVTVSNVGDGKSTILVNVFPSTALSNGSVVVYSSETDKLLDSAFDFSNYVTIQSDDFNDNNQLELAPNESKNVHFTINIPSSTNLSGSLLGGINFSQQVGLETTSKTVGVETIFERVVPVNLQFDEDRSIKDLSYEDFSFSAINNSVKLSFNVYNRNAFLGNLNNASYVLESPSNKVVSAGVFSNNVPITAMSIVPLSIPLNDGTELVNGEYKLTIESSRKVITTSFTYTKEALHEFIKENKDNSAVVIKSSTNSLVLIIISILLISLAGTIIYIIKSNIKKEK